MMNRTRNESHRELRRKAAFLFDLDGCIYYGGIPAAGARELLLTLKDRGVRALFVTNNSTHSAAQVAEMLRSIGIAATPDQVVTATDHAGSYVLQRFGPVKVKAAGTEALRESLACAGHIVLERDDPERADVIVVGRDMGFSYATLQWIAAEERNGAAVIGTNPDRYHLGSRGEKVPETGALAAAVESMIGRSIEYVGKPEAFLFASAAKRCGLRPEQCVMVGDNLYTDIAGGNRAGMTTAWVIGEQTELPDASEIERIRPDHTVKTLAELNLLIAGEAEAG
ncbi:HAD-IIA family hydrolase [Paenibacillus sp. TRM 82003]|nr:HAD-IIA family hydrolase [Paenibacillus sp. TRM 82003]MCI3923365.1 HAD-IIA family hydrolase [Paenibacillus sp. TRM 82003]